MQDFSSVTSAKAGYANNYDGRTPSRYDSVNPTYRTGPTLDMGGRPLIGGGSHLNYYRDPVRPQAPKPKPWKLHALLSQYYACAFPCKCQSASQMFNLTFCSEWPLVKGTRSVCLSWIHRTLSNKSLRLLTYHRK